MLYLLSYGDAVVGREVTRMLVAGLGGRMGGFIEGGRWLGRGWLIDLEGMIG